MATLASTAPTALTVATALPATKAFAVTRDVTADLDSRV